MRAGSILVALLASGLAHAEGWVTMTRGDDHQVELGKPGARKVVGYASPRRSGWTALDTWFQVAPGGKAFATWSPGGNGLRLFGADGTQRHRSDLATVAFRFSPDGARLAVATTRGLDVVDVASGERKSLARQAGIERIRFADAGIVVLVRRGALADLVAYGDARTVVAKGRRLETFGAAGAHIAWSERGTLVVDGEKLPFAARDPVRHLEVAADGRVLFATMKQVWLRAPGAAPALVVDEPEVHSLFFAPDGSAYLWASRARGALVGATPAPLPGTLSVRFREDGPGLVVTTGAGIELWNGADKKHVAGISPDDGDNIAANLLAGEMPLAVYRIKSGSEKIHQVPHDAP